MKKKNRLLSLHAFVRVFVLLILQGCASLFGSGSNSRSELIACYMIDNQWGPWNYLGYSNYFQTGLLQAYSWELYGSYGDFKLLENSDQPWGDYVFRVKIDNFSKPTQDEIKRHKKNNEPFVYSGTFEYYVSDTRPTARSVFSYSCFLKSNHAGVTTVKRTARATIKIMPYSRAPQIYNIFFDDVGIALDLGSEKLWQW